MLFSVSSPAIADSTRNHVTRSLTSRLTATGATAEVNERMSKIAGLQCNGKHRGTFRRIRSTDQRDRGTRRRLHRAQKKQTITHASRSKLMSELAQLRAHVSSGRRVCKDGARAAVVIKATIIDNDRSARLTTMMNVMTRQTIVFVVELQRPRRRPPTPHDYFLCHCIRPTATELR